LTGGNKAAVGKDAHKSLLGKKEIAYTFKARSHAELQAWWDIIRVHVKSARKCLLLDLAQTDFAAVTEAPSEATQPRSVYAGTISNVGLPTDTESGFTKHPDSSSFVTSEYSTTGTEHAEVAEQSRSYLPSAIGIPALHHKGSAEFSESGSSVEEEEAGVVHHPQDPIREALVAAQGPSTLGDERPTVDTTYHSDSQKTPNPSQYGETTPHVTQTHIPYTNVEGELPAYVGSSTSGYLPEKKSAEE
jgi:hypothetical protein